MSEAMRHANPPTAGLAVSIPEAFAAQVRRHGERPAVVDGARVLTYRELYDLSRRTACALRSEAGGEAGGEARSVAILAAHGADLVVALLAALEVGRIAVVLDPADPPERLRELLAEARAGAVVADALHRVLAAVVAPTGCAVVALDHASDSDCAAGRSTGAAPSPNDPAFIMFTSGSTGKPKGVIATHANVVRSARNYAAAAEIVADDRMTLLSRGHFMAAVSAIFGALLNGACLLPFDVRRRGFRELRDWLLAERVTVYHSVPTLFRRFAESLSQGEAFPSIRLVKLGGESVMNHDVKLWKRHFPESSVLVNGLGLSEANGNLCHFKIGHDTSADFRVVPVGYPLPGVEIVLLGDDGRPVPAGETGEIAFRCPHRSPGYWRSDEFAARLVALPSGGAGERFYKTGDLGRFQSDGCLEHLGRNDGLLKLRGVGIEPARVEAALMEDPRIRECAVGLRGEGSRPQQLLAWFVAVPGADPPLGELRERVSRSLPAALVPSAFVALSEMPLTPGGKIDRKALPAPPRTTGPADDGSSKPRDGIEFALSRLWRKLLKAPSIGRADNFFECGGDSLLAAVLVSKLESRFLADVPLADFMAAPTIGATAELIRRVSKDPAHRHIHCTRPGGPATPFFYVPGAAVVASEPNATAGPAPGPRSHYSLQYRGIDGVEAPSRTIPEIAGYFLEEVRKIQALGPYLLGGGSFGALVALEAAHRLRDAGEEVRLLVVEDSVLDGSLTPRAGLSWRGRIERAFLWLMPLGRRYEFTHLGLREGLRQWRYRALAPVARWWSRSRAEPVPKIHRIHDLLNCSLVAKREHVLRPYHGRVALLRSRFEAAARLFDLEPTLGWSRLCPHLERHDLAREKGGRDADAGEQTARLELLDIILAEAEAS